MRGTISQTIQILRFIAEQGLVSIDDINRYLFNENKFRIIRSILYRMGINHIRYCNYYGGLWSIDNQKHYDLLAKYFPQFPEFKVTSVSIGLIPHYLELNQIRIALEKSPKMSISQWWSETYIRALTPSMRAIVSNTKIPDAIFWRKRKDGNQQKFFLEYERSLKSKERYEEILSLYANREDVEGKNVVYICKDESIKNELSSIEENLAKRGKIEGISLYFQFITLEDFYKSYPVPNPIQGDDRYEQESKVYANAVV